MVEADRSSLSRLAFAAIFATTLITAIGNTGLISVMPAIGRELRIPDSLVASIFSLSALLWAVASPTWARLSDRKGRKPFLLLGLLGFVASMTGCGLIVAAGARQLAAPLAIFAAFFVVRSSYGLFGSASATASQAYIAERTQGRQRVRSLAAMSGALNLGTIVGPAVAPFLIFPPAGLAGPMFVFALGAAVILAIVLLAVPREPGRSLPEHAVDARQVTLAVWRQPAVRPFLVYGLVVCSAQAANTYSLGFLVIDQLGLRPVDAQRAIGLAMVAGAVAGLVAQWGLVSLCGLKPRQMLRAGAALAFAGNALIALLSGYELVVAGFAAANFGYGLARPGFAAGASLAADDAQQGSVAGAVSSIAGISIVLPPIVAVALYEIMPRLPFALIAAALLMLFVYALMHPTLSATASENSRIVS